MQDVNNDLDSIKKSIIELFIKNVKGRKPDTSGANANHDGKDGHWLEVQMGIRHNGNNAPDINGFEMKNHTASKTTFGDWSPDIAVFKGKNKLMVRDAFLAAFGSPNAAKGNRYSWSGRPCPKIDVYNDYGQILKIDRENNILAIYSFSKDKRQDKTAIIPRDMQIEDLVLAQWSAEKMETKVERKFNQLGWFKCIKNSAGIYTEIVFGEPIDFENWITGVKRGDIFFDSGMYAGNQRPYSQWRATNSYWDSLVTERF